MGGLPHFSFLASAVFRSSIFFMLETFSFALIQEYS